MVLKEASGNHNGQQAARLNAYIRKNDRDSLKISLKKIPPFKIAEILTQQKKRVRNIIFENLDSSSKEKVFDYLPPYIQKRFLRSLPRDTAAHLLNVLSPDDRTTLLQELPYTVINELLKFLSQKERTEALTLLGYPKGSVGRLMTPDYISIKPDWTIQKVLDHILNYGHDSETISLLYVVDEKGKLLDDIKLRHFLFIPRTQKVESLMDHEFVALAVDSDDETSIQLFRKFDRMALPVIDQNGILLGIVTIDDILRLSDKEATADIQKIGGQTALDEPYMDTSFLGLMKKRAGWLAILFIGEMLTATVLGYFEQEIAQAVILALFLPLIISSGGNAGGQATTLIVRAMALGEITLRDWWKVLKREIFSGLFLGIFLGSIGFLRIALWSQFTNIYGEHWFLIATTIFGSLTGVVLWGTISGATFPFILRSLGLDPAAASAPFVATTSDVTGIVIYFLIALYMLSGTLL